MIAVLFVLAYTGLLMPALPDIPFLLAGFGVYHFFINDQELGLGFWITAIIITLLLIAIEYFASGIAAKRAGGSNWSILVSALGMIVFSLFLGPIGIIVGPLVTVFIFEYARTKDFSKALSIGVSTFIGFIGGLVIKFLILTGLLIWFFIIIIV